MNTTYRQEVCIKGHRFILKSDKAPTQEQLNDWYKDIEDILGGIDEKGAV